MQEMLIVLIGFTAGIFTMAIISFYKWFLEMLNSGF